MRALRNESLSSSLCIFFRKARLSSKVAWILKETDSETASLMGQHRFVRAWGYSFRYENKVRVGRERRSVRVDATAWLESKRGGRIYLIMLLIKILAVYLILHAHSCGRFSLNVETLQTKNISARMQFRRWSMKFDWRENHARFAAKEMGNGWMEQNSLLICRRKCVRYRVYKSFCAIFAQNNFPNLKITVWVLWIFGILTLIFIW